MDTIDAINSIMSSLTNTIDYANNKFFIIEESNEFDDLTSTQWFNSDLNTRSFIMYEVINPELSHFIETNPNTFASNLLNNPLIESTIDFNTLSHGLVSPLPHSVEIPYDPVSDDSCTTTYESLDD